MLNETFIHNCDCSLVAFSRRDIQARLGTLRPAQMPTWALAGGIAVAAGGLSLGLVLAVGGVVTCTAAITLERKWSRLAEGNVRRQN